MTAIRDRASSIFRKARTYLLATGLTGFAAYALGYHGHSGLQALIMDLPKAIVVGLLSSLIGGWIPLAVDLEHHRLWRAYIILFFFLEALLLLLLGYSIAAGNG